MPKARKVAFPVESQLHRNLDQAFYSDAFETDLVDASLTPVAIATRALASTPGWVEGLVELRDRIVSLFRLKQVGRLKLAGGARSLSEPAVGDAFSIFRVVFVDSSELVLGIDDTHLDVRMSFLKRLTDSRASYVVSSWVKTHNVLGRVYMLPVAPVHRLLVSLMMRGVRM
ncbi:MULTISPECIES: DUF2867 domain-containing protein [unclassified Bradyrhizobium]|uniref:DUF2867 domain-containing protein n=1 Tax=unclassified Bradyrhizobium TaxID=2631580 RepID=UPI0028E22E84|nr:MULTISPECIES: DUF2867 domain-containing protein [unclassified Bradyrhizobium]